MEDKLFKRMLKQSILLSTLLACFYLDESCDELIPNENWHKLSNEEREKVREYFRGID